MTIHWQAVRERTACSVIEENLITSLSLGFPRVIRLTEVESAVSRKIVKNSAGIRPSIPLLQVLQGKRGQGGMGLPSLGGLGGSVPSLHRCVLLGLSRPLKLASAQASLLYPVGIVGCYTHKKANFPFLGSRREGAGMENHL